MAASDSNTSPPPSRGVAAPAGFLATPSIQHQASEKDQGHQRRLKAIAAILKDPLKVQELSHRVYRLMDADFTIQRERGGQY